MSLILFWLLVGHALCDYPLQGDFMARAKNRRLKIEYQNVMVANEIWPFVLSAHALIHAGAVALVMDSLLLGMTEFVVHWIIDYAKCQDTFGFRTDQVLHILCKLVYVAVMFGVI